MSNSFKKLVATICFLVIFLISFWYFMAGLDSFGWDSSGYTRWATLFGGVAIGITSLILYIEYLRTNKKSLFWTLSILFILLLLWSIIGF